MTAESSMSIAVYVIDTSYLLELFQVPTFSDSVSISEVKNSFDNAIMNKSRFYVPLPCIFEFADHIADVKNGSVRNRIADSFYKTVKNCVEDGKPWIITSIDIEELTQLCDNFANQYVLQCIGLTDTTIISEAYRLKKKFSGLGYTVHIWTKEKKIKSYEPDTEEDPFLGVD